MKFWCELVRDFDNVYSANLKIGNSRDASEHVMLPEYVDWRTIQWWIFKKTGVRLFFKDLRWDKLGRKKYAYVEGEVVPDSPFVCGKGTGNFSENNT